MSSDYLQFYPLIQEFRPTIFTEEEFIRTLKNIEHNSEIWVAEYNNELIGTATVFYEQKFIYNLIKMSHIEDVCVKGAYRRRGIGKMLVDKLIEQSKSKGCYKVVLDCSEENSNFYMACNFEKRGVQMSYLIREV